MSNFGKSILLFLVLHCGGMIGFVAALDAKGGCSKPYLERPAYCFSYKTGAGIWEIIVLYHVTYSIIEGL